MGGVRLPTHRRLEPCTAPQRQVVGASPPGRNPGAAGPTPAEAAPVRKRQLTVLRQTRTPPAGLPVLGGSFSKFRDSAVRPDPPRSSCE